MKRRTRFFPILILFLLAIQAASAEEAAQVGQVDFPTSGGREAQKHFERGVLYLHSFEYKGARDAFREAREAEPGFAMAHWGEAMTFNHPIWREEDAEAAREALNRLAPTPQARAARALTEREKGYMRTVEVLYGEGDKRSRDEAYSVALGDLSSRYPDDLDARSFYALSILGTCHSGRDTATYMRAAAVLEEVFDADPEHPGAAHYLIHAYDDAVHAPLGLRPARAYARIAPPAGHALHVPSRIFLALGLWDEAAMSNLDSWLAVEKQVSREGLPSDRRNYPVLLWLQYAYLQRGRYREAQENRNTIMWDARKSKTVRARTHFAFMHSAFIVNTERWHLAEDMPDLTGLDPTAVCAALFARGMAAVRTEKLAVARSVLGTMRRHIAAAKGKESPSTTGAVRAEAMTLELEGLIRVAEGRTDDGLGALARASEIEDQLPYVLGPPIPVKPAHELYGEVLLFLGQAHEARAEFEKALARAPNRLRAVRGLEQATAALAGEAVVRNPVGPMAPAGRRRAPGSGG